MPALPQGAEETAVMPPGGTAFGYDSVGREQLLEMLPDGQRADTRAAAPVRDTERLVQVQVAYVRSNRPIRPGWHRPTSALRLAPSR